MIATISGSLSSNPSSYTYPVYYADAGDPTYTVTTTQYKWTVCSSDTSCVKQDSIQVRIPSAAVQSAGTDAQMIVIDRDSGYEYDLWGAARTSNGGWTIRNGSRYSVNWRGTTSPVIYGSRGAGVPYLAGLIRPEELKAGVIEHALAFAYPSSKSGTFVFPATKTDGTNTGTYSIPEGARIRLDPTATEADFTAWGLDRSGKIIARAMQRYGMYLIDVSGSNKIYAEDLTVNTYRQAAGWSYANADTKLSSTTVSKIPVSRLQILDLP